MGVEEISNAGTPYFFFLPLRHCSSHLNLRQDKIVTTTNFSFVGMMIERMIAHRIFPKDANRQRISPNLSTAEIALNTEAKSTISSRLTSALSNRSHGIQMTIARSDVGSFFDIGSSMLHSDLPDFIAKSAQLAENLTDAQYNTNAPGGVLLVMQGRVGPQSSRFVCIIKAEPQDGFQTKNINGSIGIEYLKELLLTANQKFYKIGFLVENTATSERKPSNFSAFLYDHLMTQTESRPAAGYFYRTFLGMDMAESAKKQTRDFYNLTKQYIDTSDLTDDEKLDAHEALRTTLKSNVATLQVSDFATNHLPDNKKYDYETFMSNIGFPTHAINKDVEFIKDLLRKRRVYRFSNDVKISTPTNKDQKEYFSLDSSDGGDYTIITIKGSLESQQ